MFFHFEQLFDIYAHIHHASFVRFFDFSFLQPNVWPKINEWIKHSLFFCLHSFCWFANAFIHFLCRNVTFSIVSAFCVFFFAFPPKTNFGLPLRRRLSAQNRFHHHLNPFLSTLSSLDSLLQPIGVALALHSFVHLSYSRIRFWLHDLRISPASFWNWFITTIRVRCTLCSISSCFFARLAFSYFHFGLLSGSSSFLISSSFLHSVSSSFRTRF